MDPREKGPKPPHTTTHQEYPGTEAEMDPKPDYGEESYKGSGKLKGKSAVITGGDSGIGRAVALAFAREGADVLISYLSEETDAKETARRGRGRRAEMRRRRGRHPDEAHCKAIIERAVKEFGKIDILVNNAAFQMTRESSRRSPPRSSTGRSRRTSTPCSGCPRRPSRTCPKAGRSSTPPRSRPIPRARNCCPYAMTKAAIQNFTGGLAQMLGKKGIRANCVAPGPIWTPLIPATMPPEKVKDFGKNVALGRPGQPAELAPVFVLLASEDRATWRGRRSR